MDHKCAKLDLQSRVSESHTHTFANQISWSQLQTLQQATYMWLSLIYLVCVLVKGMQWTVPTGAFNDINIRSHITCSWWTHWGLKSLRFESRRTCCFPHNSASLSAPPPETALGAKRLNYCQNTLIDRQRFNLKRTLYSCLPSTKKARTQSCNLQLSRRAQLSFRFWSPADYFSLSSFCQVILSFSLASPPFFFPLFPVGRAIWLDRPQGTERDSTRIP